MTKRERAQVVELLRCAADTCCFGDLFAFGSSRLALGIKQGSAIHNATCLAIVETVGIEGDDWQRSLLEAAQRIEEGSYP